MDDESAAFSYVRDMLIDVRIELLYFGVLKDVFGCARESLVLADGSRVKDAIRLLRDRASKRCASDGSPLNAEERQWASLAVAVNREYSDTSTVLRDGDEVALLPPVSGGMDSAELRVLG